MQKRICGRPGFTLAEVAVTAGLIALIASTAILSFPALLDKYRLKRAETGLAAALREAQLHAYREGRYWRVVIAPDGGGYALDYATSGTASCDGPGWTRVKEERFTGARVGVSSRACAVFGPSGRSEWPNPVVLVDDTDPPTGGSNAMILIVDGQTIPAASPRADPGTVVWDRWGDPTPVIITLDVKESRYFTSICPDVFSSWAFDNFGYPAHITVEAANGSYPPDHWTTLYDQSGPPDPQGEPDENGNPTPGPPESICPPIPVNGAYRYFRFTLYPNGEVVVLDEIDFGELFFTLQAGRASRTVKILPVTGRVTVQ
jgi:Tfp pilus assembly protein FimT